MAAEVRAGINRLAISRTAWELRSFCDGYCRVVHSHHSIKDFRIFPAVLAAAPELAPVIEKLTADHIALGRLTGILSQTVAALSGPEASWEAAGEAAQALADHLTAHLDLEEEHLVPHVARLPEWV